MKKINTMLFIIACSLVVLSATSLVAADDPNEGRVTDDRDFHRANVSYRAPGILAEVIFYQPPHQSGFWFYVSTDSADFAVRCNGTSVSVHDNTSGSPGPALYTGRPSIRGNKYTFRIPISSLGLSPGSKHELRYWFFWMAAPGVSAADRIPDSGNFNLIVY